MQASHSTNQLRETHSGVRIYLFMFILTRSVSKGLSPSTYAD